MECLGFGHCCDQNKALGMIAVMDRARSRRGCRVRGLRVGVTQGLIWEVGLHSGVPRSSMGGALDSGSTAQSRALGMEDSPTDSESWRGRGPSWRSLGCGVQSQAALEHLRRKGSARGRVPESPLSLPASLRSPASSRRFPLVSGTRRTRSRLRRCARPRRRRSRESPSLRGG